MLPRVYDFIQLDRVLTWYINIFPRAIINRVISLAALF